MKVHPFYFRNVHRYAYHLLQCFCYIHCTNFFFVAFFSPPSPSAEQQCAHKFTSLGSLNFRFFFYLFCIVSFLNYSSVNSTHSLFQYVSTAALLCIDKVGRRKADVEFGWLRAPVLRLIYVNSTRERKTKPLLSSPSPNMKHSRIIIFVIFRCYHYFYFNLNLWVLTFTFLPAHLHENPNSYHRIKIPFSHIRATSLNIQFQRVLSWF